MTLYNPSRLFPCTVLELIKPKSGTILPVLEETLTLYSNKKPLYVKYLSVEEVLLTVHPVTFTTTNSKS